MIKVMRKMRNNKGLTLIELMVVLAILSLVILGLVSFFSGGVRSWISGQSQLKTQREARHVMDRMVREIREASYVKDSSGIYKIEFYNPNNDQEKVYSYNDLDNEIKEGSASLLKNVSAFSFSYYDNNGLVVDPPDSSRISNVKIYLEMNVDNDDNPDIILNSEASLRNFNL